MNGHIMRTVKVIPGSTIAGQKAFGIM